MPFSLTSRGFFAEKQNHDMTEFPIKSLLWRINKSYPSAMLKVTRAISYTSLYVEDIIFFILDSVCGPSSAGHKG